MPDFESAFAMTVHKSQGSEYREVWLLPPSVPATTESEEEARGLDKALLYTAITRARERFVFWGNAEELCQAVGCHQNAGRHWPMPWNGSLNRLMSRLLFDLNQRGRLKRR